MPSSGKSKKINPRKILLSKCLLGYPCRYDGKSIGKNAKFDELAANGAVLICPEEAGGLPTPRPPAEILENDGHAVLDGKAKVINIENKDVTDNYLKGAEETLSLAVKNKIELAILKARSPSCGVGAIYDGSFSGKLKEGDGVTTALLKKNGFTVISDEDYSEER